MEKGDKDFMNINQNCSYFVQHIEGYVSEGQFVSGLFKTEQS